MIYRHLGLQMEVESGFSQSVLVSERSRFAIFGSELHDERSLAAFCSSSPTELTIELVL